MVPDEIRRVPYDALEAFGSIWREANPPTEERECVGYLDAGRAKIDYPTVWVQRKSEVEGPLWSEMRGIAERCESGGIEAPCFYARPDGELLFAPEAILRRRLLEKTSPAGIELLTFISFFASRNIEIAALAGAIRFMGDEVGAGISSEANAVASVLELVQDLWSRNLVWKFDGVGFQAHEYVDGWLRRTMSQEVERAYQRRVVQALDHLAAQTESSNWLSREIERQLENSGDEMKGRDAQLFLRLKKWLNQAKVAANKPHTSTRRRRRTATNANSAPPRTTHAARKRKR
jgi:hypothetical protein